MAIVALLWFGSVVARLLKVWARTQGSRAFSQRPWTNRSYPRASVTKQYNLVLTRKDGHEGTRGPEGIKVMAAYHRVFGLGHLRADHPERDQLRHPTLALTTFIWHFFFGGGGTGGGYFNFTSELSLLRWFYFYSRTKSRYIAQTSRIRAAVKDNAFLVFFLPGVFPVACVSTPRRRNGTRRESSPRDIDSWAAESAGAASRPTDRDNVLYRSVQTELDRADSQTAPPASESPTFSTSTYPTRWSSCKL